MPSQKTMRRLTIESRDYAKAALQANRTMRMCAIQIPQDVWSGVTELNAALEKWIAEMDARINADTPADPIARYFTEATDRLIKDMEKTNDE
jgi:hypothetical protein